MNKTLPDEWYYADVDLTTIDIVELIKQIDQYMPRDSTFTGHENLCALWDELKMRAWESILP